MTLDHATCLAAVEMANEGLGHDLLNGIMWSVHVRYVQNGFRVATSDGVFDIVRNNTEWVCK